MDPSGNDRSSRAAPPGGGGAGGGNGDGAPQDVRARVLIVDDEPSVLRVVSRVLTRGGFDVLEASGAEDAFRLAEEHLGGIDLLLTDVVMPRIGGRELAEAFRARYPAVPILFMSAYTDDDLVLQGALVPDAAFIAKPFTVDALLDKVTSALKAGR